MNAPIWLAFTVFASPDACSEYVQQNKLMEQWDWQCVLIEPDPIEKPLAPAMSLRPQQRPTNLGVKK